MSRRWLVVVSVAAHLCILVGVFVSGVWRIERMDRGASRPRLDWHPPPPPASSSGPVARVDFKNDPRRPPVVKETVQPTPHVDTTPRPPEDKPPGTGTGSGSGDPDNNSTCTENCGQATEAPPPAPVCGNNSLETGEQCDDGNTLDGDGCSSTCRTEPRRPQTAMIAPSMLSALRISGETQLHPSAVTQNQMVRDGVSRVEARVTVCVTTSGSVGSAAMRTSTGYAAYDQDLLAAVRDWRYRPYMVNGTQVPACSIVRFIYTIQ
ncbi:MAG TPA: TonB family protein [Kofleriaceae bacterium]